MKKTLTLIMTFVLVLAMHQAHSQLEKSSFTQTGSAYSVSSINDYQSLGINPANLGWKRNGHTMNLGFLESAFSVYSEPLGKKEVIRDLIMGSSDAFETAAQRREAIASFTDTRLLASISIMSLGFSYQDEKVGGFAFTVRDNIHWNSDLNGMASRFLFTGYEEGDFFNDPYFDSIALQPNGDTIAYATDPQKASWLYHPTDIEHVYYREYILGYGRKFVDKDDFKFYAGIDIKYLQGYGILDYTSVSETEVDGYQALCPFYQVNYSDPTPSQMEGEGMKAAGHGFGFDIGVTFEIIRKIRASIALNDMGFINWDGNVYEGENVDITQIETNGINSYNIFEEGQGIIADNNNLGEWKGLKEKKVNLASNMRVGGSYLIQEGLEVGTDFLIPLQAEVPGAFKKLVFGLGTRYDPLPWVQLSTGFMTGGQFAWAIPLGVTLRPVNKEHVSWELGFAFRDFSTFFKQEDPNVSLAMGFLRFSFGTGGSGQRFPEE